MDALGSLLEIFLHTDRQLADAVSAYGPWVYALLFGIVFCETGIVITPFLPGDSLLFAADVLLTLLGYFLGSHPLVKESLSPAIGTIVVLSVLPVAHEAWRRRSARRAGR